MPMASDTFAKDFPIFNSYGWGVSAKAERWNGRHAMFGWVFIVATGYCQAHGLIPNPTQALDFKEWGTLAIISGGKGGGLTITNERACILIANVHFLAPMSAATRCQIHNKHGMLVVLQVGPNRPPSAHRGYLSISGRREWTRFLPC